MATLSNQPDNLNFLSPLGFRFFLKRSPNVNFFLTEAGVPSLSVNNITIPSPFQNLNAPGSGKISFSDFDITFKVDEEMRNYQEIYDWIVSDVAPERFSQYLPARNAAAGSGLGVYSDGTLTVLNSAYRPIIEYQFQRMYPSQLSELRFSTAETDVEYITARASFKFEIMTINRLI